MELFLYAALPHKDVGAFYSFQIMLIGCYLIMGLEWQKTEC